MFKHTVLTGTFGGRANSIYNCPNPAPVTESIDLLLHPNLNVDEDNVVYLRQCNQSHADGRPHWGEEWRYIYFWRTHGGVFVEYGDANTKLGSLFASKGSPEGMGQHVYGGDPVLLPNKCIISDVALLQRIALEFLRDCEKAPAIVEWLPDPMISPEDDRWERFAV